MTPRRRLLVLSLALLGYTLMIGCATEFPGDPAAFDEIDFPNSIAVHPNGRFLYVTNANFDLEFRVSDGGLISVIDLEAGALVAGRSKRISSFAGDLVLNAEGTRGYIAVRGDDSITWFAVSEDGGEIFCPNAPQADNLDDCRFTVAEEPTSLAYSRETRSQTLTDSNGNILTDENGDPQTVDVTFDLLVTAHLRAGRVSVTTVREVPEQAQPLFDTVSSSLIDSPSDVVKQPGTNRYFVAGRVASELVTFQPVFEPNASVVGVFQDRPLAVPTPFSGFEGRNLLFSEDGRRLYMTNQTPNALVIFDTSRRDDDTVSGQRDQIIAQIDLPQDPNTLAWVPTPEGDELLYITSFDDNAIIIVEPSIPAVIGRLAVGEGPFQLMLDAPRDRAYVNNFAENSISVIDISDPRQPTEVSIITNPGQLESILQRRETLR